MALQPCVLGRSRHHLNAPPMYGAHKSCRGKRVLSCFRLRRLPVLMKVQGCGSALDSQHNLLPRHGLDPYGCLGGALRCIHCSIWHTVHWGCHVGRRVVCGVVVGKIDVLCVIWSCCREWRLKDTFTSRSPQWGPQASRFTRQEVLY
jgi:hypothetical protein